MEMSDWLASIRSAFADLEPTVTAYVPRIATALLLVALGWLVATLLRMLVRKTVQRLERLVRRRAGFQGEEQTASRFVSSITFWVVFLFFVAAATERLGLPAVTEAVSMLAAYLPAVLGGILIVLAALVLADFAKRGVVSTASASGIRQADLLGRLAKSAILLVGGVLALDQLGVQSTVLVALTATVAGVLLGGATLAFALGAPTTVSNILASHYLLQTYRPGQTIQVGSYTGRIVDITPGGVILDAPEGQVMVPAKTFSESISILIPEQVRP